MTDTRELVEWLRYQLHTDEALARNAYGAHNDVDPHWHEVWSGSLFLNAGETEDLAPNDASVARHIINWDPARVLTVILATRRMIELVDAADGLDHQVESDCGVGPRDEVNDPYIGDTMLRVLAEPYASRPGYREEWRLTPADLRACASACPRCNEFWVHAQDCPNANEARRARPGLIVEAVDEHGGHGIGVSSESLDGSPLTWSRTSSQVRTSTTAPSDAS